MRKNSIAVLFTLYLLEKLIIQMSASVDTRIARSCATTKNGTVAHRLATRQRYGCEGLARNGKETPRRRRQRTAGKDTILHFNKLIIERPDVMHTPSFITVSSLFDGLIVLQN